MRIIRLTMLGTSALLASGPAVAAPDTFCQRLAPKMNMKQIAGSPKGQAPEWKVNLLGGLGPALFGGSAVASFSVRPIDPTTGNDYRRVEGACQPTDKGAVCEVQGPARLTIRTKTGEIVSDVSAGERPVIEMRKTTIYCRD